MISTMTAFLPSEQVIQVIFFFFLFFLVQWSVVSNFRACLYIRLLLRGLTPPQLSLPGPEVTVHLNFLQNKQKALVLEWLWGRCRFPVVSIPLPTPNVVHLHCTQTKSMNLLLIEVPSSGENQSFHPLPSLASLGDCELQLLRFLSGGMAPGLQLSSFPTQPEFFPCRYPFE